MGFEKLSSGKVVTGSKSPTCMTCCIRCCIYYPPRQHTPCHTVRRVLVIAPAPQLRHLLRQSSSVLSIALFLPFAGCTGPAVHSSGVKVSPSIRRRAVQRDILKVMTMESIPNPHHYENQDAVSAQMDAWPPNSPSTTAHSFPANHYLLPLKPAWTGKQQW